MHRKILSFSILNGFLALMATPLLVKAGPEAPVSDKSVLLEPDHHSRPDSHAPLGVMNDHTHKAGEIMFGYRYVFSHDEGIKEGSQSIPRSEVFHRYANDGFYTAAPVEMDMHMHMLEFMYAPADWVTLMVMPMYMEMDMTMESRGGHGHGGHMEAMGHDHMAMGHEDMKSTLMNHGTAGWSDTLVTAMFPVINSDTSKVHLDLGLSIPTGSVNQKMHGAFTHYMMQLGSGTWDIKPGLTYQGFAGDISWGAQAMGTFRLEDANDSGYRLGDAVDVTGWTAYRLCDWASVSARLAWHNEGQIEGHYHGAHNHSSPPDLQRNYGGDRLDAGLGINFLIPEGPLKGHRLAIEALTPVYQNVNGIQLERDVTLYAGWQYSF